DPPASRRRRVRRQRDSAGSRTGARGARRGGPACRPPAQRLRPHSADRGGRRHHGDVVPLPRRVRRGSRSGERPRRRRPLAGRRRLPGTGPVSRRGAGTAAAGRGGHPRGHAVPRLPGGRLGRAQPRRDYASRAALADQREHPRLETLPRGVPVGGGNLRRRTGPDGPGRRPRLGRARCAAGGADGRVVPPQRTDLPARVRAAARPGRGHRRRGGRPAGPARGRM
ncbi:MAG: Haloacid dehalogenase, type II, partial [uncultured Blastococcus sp.]